MEKADRDSIWIFIMEKADRDSIPKQEEGRINQPMTPEEVDPAQKRAQKEELLREGNNLTANQGDRIDDSKSIEEKAKQVA
ncbi:MAG: hypothetical protein F6K28_34740, partial [Microcoleus sp. SIO2G3]|nr:hypothetical protein [Microcoleus sp. SIO2G3]